MSPIGFIGIQDIYILVLVILIARMFGMLPVNLLLPIYFPIPENISPRLNLLPVKPVPTTEYASGVETIIILVLPFF